MCAWCCSRETSSNMPPQMLSLLQRGQLTVSFLHRTACQKCQRLSLPQLLYLQACTERRVAETSRNLLRPAWTNVQVTCVGKLKMALLLLVLLLVVALQR